MPYRVLLVAPRTSLLLVDAEIQDVLRSGLFVTPLLGNVIHIDLTREIRRTEYDCLWLATHGNDAGVFLSDGLLSMSALTQLIRGRFSLVVLNTCTSVYSAQQIQNETNADVVCTVIDAPDDEAYRTGSLFANALAELGDPRAAYEQSKPGGNRLYLYLTGARNEERFLSRH